MVPVLTAEILGLPIPDAGPLFAIALAIHIGCGLTAVLAGALAATAKKRLGRHPRAGHIYLWALGGIFTTAAIMAAIMAAILACILIYLRVRHVISLDFSSHQT